MGVEIPDRFLIKELHRLEDELDRPPTLTEIRKQGAYSAMTYIERFGSWNEALEAAGFEPREPDSKIPEEELVDEIERVLEEVGEPPSASQMNEHGNYSASTFKRHFGSWNAALKEAGLSPRKKAGPIPEDDLISELLRIADEVDSTPTMEAMERDGKYSATTYERRFGSWSDALRAAGIEPTFSPSHVTDEDLIDEWLRLYEDLGRPPTTIEMDEKGEYAIATYYRHFESWSAIEELVKERGLK